MRVLGVVELDDSSHKRKDRIARDKFLNQAMADHEDGAE